MHQTVHEFVRRNLTEEEVAGKKVLEVGSLNVNGSVREYLTGLRPAEYVGVDMRPGPGVDFVCKAEDVSRFWTRGYFDVVISTEMLEHVLHWREAVTAMKHMVAPGGILMLTTRSVGFPLHEYPGDYWRFIIEDMRHIFSDMYVQAIEPDTLVSGVFVRASNIDDTHLRPKDLSGYSVYMMPGGQ
jgi:SAM-dependent methyltransferase